MITMNIKSVKKTVLLPFKKERFFSYILIPTGILIIINFLYLSFNFQSEGVTFPIKYNYLFGIVKTGNWSSLYILPLLSLTIAVVNTFFSYFFYKKDKFLSYIFLSVNIFFSIIILLETIALVTRSI